MFIKNHPFWPKYVKRRLESLQTSFKLFSLISLIINILQRAEFRIPPLEVVVMDIEIRFLRYTNARMPKDAAQRVNVHPRKQTALSEIISKCMRRNVLLYAYPLEVTPKISFILRNFQFLPCTLHGKSNFCFTVSVFELYPSSQLFFCPFGKEYCPRFSSLILFLV